MTKKTKNDPRIRQEMLFREEADAWQNLSLDQLLARFQKAKAEALKRDPSFTDFRVDIARDEYECDVSIWGTRPENSTEKLDRLNRLRHERETKKNEAAKRKEYELAELKRLCKKLKVNSPV